MREGTVGEGRYHRFGGRSSWEGVKNYKKIDEFTTIFF